MPKSDAGFLSLQIGQLGLKVAGGVWEIVWVSTIIFFFNLLSKCSVHSNFFSPFKFLIRSNYCFLHSPFIEAQEMGFPLSSSAVPS